MSGSGFAQALIFSFMSKPNATRADVGQTAANAGMSLSTQGLDQRFNARAAYFLDSLLAEAMQQLVSSVPEAQSLLSRFTGVYVSDSTIVKLPDSLSTVFRGHNGDSDAAAKVAVRWDLYSGALWLWLSAGTVHDQRTAVVAQTLPAGALRLEDLGFYNLTKFAEDVAAGCYVFSRYKHGTLIFTEDGQPLDLVRLLARHGQQALDMPILLGAGKLPCRLIALPISPEQLRKRRKRLREIARKRQQPVSPQASALAGWTLYVTNIPPEKLATSEAAILGSTRWQIECLFKLWKSDGLLASTRSQDPHRVWCELYAKLLACLIQHWITLVACWQRLDRSLHQATQVIRKRAFCLLDTINDLQGLLAALSRTAAVIAQTCGLSKRAARPLTYQRWLEAAQC